MRYHHVENFAAREIGKSKKYSEATFSKMVRGTQRVPEYHDVNEEILFTHPPLAPLYPYHHDVVRECMAKEQWKRDQQCLDSIEIGVAGYLKAKERKDAKVRELVALVRPHGLMGAYNLLLGAFTLNEFRRICPLGSADPGLAGAQTVRMTSVWGECLYIGANGLLRFRCENGTRNMRRKSYLAHETKEAVAASNVIIAKTFKGDVLPNGSAHRL